MSIYTMKEMNESLGVEYHGRIEKLQEVHVLKEKVSDLPITRENMVLVNLTGHRAVYVRPEHIGRLVPSNFAIIEPKGNVNTTYLEWYLNEHPFCRKQLRIATQGTTVAALSIQMLRSLQLKLPTIDQQKAIGSMNQILDRKKRLVSERLQLEEQLVKHLSLSYFQEENK
ncbi:MULTISPECIES: hypothetical protein [Bacillus cereus group]|uniref:Restriction endonuclease subunit S n=1 Tax=Bacillus cereus TaxID=1396 RepID=A0A9W7UZA8_BACCE|nr:hypothetical protein [Bacillus cereus]KAB2400091.1 hypothetical protein F8172_00995 [Bacillus cereus]KAB2410481.1 hypothetical protein F8170_02845 [Bacillus cereus]KAB2427725.1 hypothetical protein F8168_21735 [Bacillus cereus]